MTHRTREIPINEIERHGFIINPHGGFRSTACRSRSKTLRLRARAWSSGIREFTDTNSVVQDASSKLEGPKALKWLGPPLI